MLTGDLFPHSLPRSVNPIARPRSGTGGRCARSSKRSASKQRVDFADARVHVLSQASEVTAMRVPVRSPTPAHTAFAVLPPARAVPGTAPNHAFEGIACQRGCASLRPAVAAPQRSRWAPPLPPLRTVYTLRRMRFTWRESKRRRNLRDHGHDFVDAPRVFEGPTFTYEDDRFATASSAS